VDANNPIFKNGAKISIEKASFEIYEIGMKEE